MKNFSIKAVLFDLDGTLLYTLDDITTATNIPLIKRGLSPITVEECRETVGNGLRNTVKGCMSKRNYEASEEEIDIALSELQEYYRVNHSTFSKPYEKIIEFLQNLEIPFGILSNKDDDIVKQIIPKVFPNVSFDYVAGSKDGIIKPMPNKVFEFCKQFNIKPENLLYVGDSEVDYKTAVNANSQVTLVTWGYRNKEDILKLNALTVDTVDQLWRVINEN